MNKKKFRYLPHSPDSGKHDFYEPYYQLLSNVLADNTVGNIALSGELGIGKSSIIRHVEKEEKVRFIYLTACYMDVSDSNNKGKKKTDNNELEKSLLVQLISICNEQKISKSSFRSVPSNLGFIKKIFLPFLFLLLFVALFMYNFNDKLELQNLAEHFFNGSNTFTSNLEKFALALIAVSAIGIGVYTVYRLLNYFKINSLKLGSSSSNHTAEAEVNSDFLKAEKLDENMTEIIYLFEQLGKNSRIRFFGRARRFFSVVFHNVRTFIQIKNKDKTYKKFHCHNVVFVIEDLDRYDVNIAIPILVKLKQINIALNNRAIFNNKIYTQRKKYKFIYELKESIFADKSQSVNISKNDPYKFFDAVIPIVPELTYGNSSEYFNTLFNSNYYIDRDVIKKVAPYLNDFRKLDNVWNEYNIYLTQHKKLFDDRDKDEEQLKRYHTTLLVFVIYKVFYPNEYYKLYQNNSITGEIESQLLKKCFYGSKNKNRNYNSDYFKNYLEANLGFEQDEFMKNEDIPLLKILDFSPGFMAGIRWKIIAAGKLSKNIKNPNNEKFDLSNAVLTGIVLRKTDKSSNENKIEKLNLEDADLSYGEFSEITFENLNLKKTSFKNSVFKNVVWNNNEFEGTDFTYAKFICHENEGKYYFSNITFKNVKFKNAYFENMKFINVDFQSNNNDPNDTSADFSGSYMKKISFEGTASSNMNMNNVKFNNTYLKNAEFKNVTLVNAEFQNADIRNATFLNIDVGEKPEWNYVKLNLNDLVNLAKVLANNLVFCLNNAELYLPEDDKLDVKITINPVTKSINIEDKKRDEVDFDFNLLEFKENTKTDTNLYKCLDKALKKLKESTTQDTNPAP